MSPIISKINSLSLEVLTGERWERKVQPPLVTSYIEYDSSQLITLHKSHPPPRFQLEFSELILPISTHYFQPQTQDITGVDAALQYYIQTRWPQSTNVYTDGSKNGENAGCAFYIPSDGTQMTYRLPRQTSSFSAEAIAIIKAVEHITSQQSSNNTTWTILTDSRSVVKKLGSCNIERADNPLISRMLSLVSQGKTAGINFIFVWIRGHSGIKGNEKVDNLAKRAALQNHQNITTIPSSDFNPWITSKIRAQWQQFYTAGEKGHFYKKIQPNVPRRPWYYHHQVPKPFSRTITRMRSNHGVCDAYLHRFNLQDTPQCNRCGNPNGTIEHVVMECPLFYPERDNLFKTLNTMIQLPYNYTHILSIPRLEIYKALYEYLNNCNIYI